MNTEDRVKTDIGAFAMVPVWVLEHDFGAAELRVYIALRSFADADGEGGRARREKIAERANVSVATYKRARAKLEEAGVVDKTPRLRPDGGFAGWDYHLPSLPVRPAVEAASTPSVDATQGGGGSTVEPGPGSPGEPPKYSFEKNRPGTRPKNDDGARVSAEPAPDNSAKTPGVVALVSVEGVTNAKTADQIVTSWAEGRGLTRRERAELVREVHRLLEEGAIARLLPAALDLAYVPSQWRYPGVKVLEFAWRKVRDAENQRRNPVQQPLMAPVSTGDRRTMEMSDAFDRVLARKAAANQQPAPAYADFIEGEVVA